MIIKYGAEIDSKERNHGYTPLHLAVYHSKFTTEFLQSLDDHNNEFYFDFFVLDFFNIVEFLISENANVNSVGTDGDSILHTASDRGNFIFHPFYAKSIISRLYCLADKRVVELLIKHGANVNSINNDHQTALHKSAFIGNFQNES